MAAHRVPPVAIKSSTTKARSPDLTAPTCISRQSLPYSRIYFSEITSPVNTTISINKIVNRENMNLSITCSVFEAEISSPYKTETSTETNDINTYVSERFSDVTDDMESEN